MRKPWRLTRHAEASLTHILRWTIATFGSHQAQSYKENLLSQCRAIANGEAFSQDCTLAFGLKTDWNIRLTRCGQHFIVFTDQTETVIILDFLHRQSDLPSHLAILLSTEIE